MHRVLTLAFRGWEPDGEGAAPVDGALHADLSAMGLDEAFRDVQSQPESDPLRARSPRLVEAIEQFGELVRWNSHPLVTHDDLEAVGRPFQCHVNGGILR